MSEREHRQVDELEAALSALVAGQEVPSEVGEEVRDLAQIAAHLLGLPGEDFRTRLKADLVGARLPGEAEAEPEVKGRGGPTPSRIAVRRAVSDRRPRAGTRRTFWSRAFGAEVLYRMPDAPGGGFHAEVRIGDAHVMMGGMSRAAFPETPAALHLYVPDVDAVFQRAVDAGSQALYPPTTSLWRPRSA